MLVIRSLPCDADIASGSLTVAPSTNNTALVDDIGADDTEKTRTWGEYLGHRPFITMDTVGTEISGLVGTFQSFSINDGATDEYFMAFIESATELRLALRGYYYDDSLDPINRIAFTNNDTITLMSTAWVFLTNSETLIISYNNPVWSFTEPTGPATDDMWFDFEVDFWKRYNGATFETANAIFVGNAIIDDTDCVGARSADLAAAYSRENNIRLNRPSTTTLQTRENFNVAVIAGNKIETMFGSLDWDIATDLAIAADMYDATEQANRNYYAYLTDEFEEVFSDVHPYYRPEFFGFYHPHNPWRCIGYARNDGSSDFTSFGFFPGEPALVRADWANWANQSNQNFTTGAGFEKVTITGTATFEGHAIFEVSNVIQFRMPGTYDWFFRADGRTSSAAVSRIDYRIRDTLNGVTILDLGQSEYPFNTNQQIASCSYFAQIEVTDCEVTYELQGDVSSANADHLGTQLFISKRNSLDKGWVSTT